MLSLTLKTPSAKSLEAEFNTVNDHSPLTSSKLSVTSKDYSLYQLGCGVRRTERDLRDDRNMLITKVDGLKWEFKEKCYDVSDAQDILCEKLKDRFNAATEKLENLIEQYKAWLTEKEMMEGQVND